MLKNTLQVSVLLTLPLLFATGAWAQGDPNEGEKNYPACAGCHGQSGQGSKVVSAPRLAGLGADYVARQVQNYQRGIRGATPEEALGAPMAAVAKALDATAVANVAAYIAKLDPPAGEKTVKGDAAKGKTLYATCTACHGAAGEGNSALNSPRLAGTSDWYMVRQLKSFKAGVRGSHADDTYGKQMAPMAAALTDDQAIADVVAYINSL